MLYVVISAISLPSPLAVNPDPWCGPAGAVSGFGGVPALAGRIERIGLQANPLTAPAGPSHRQRRNLPAQRKSVGSFLGPRPTSLSFAGTGRLYRRNRAGG